MAENKLPVSVVLLAKNEEINIRDCLESCSFAKELIVIDDGSTDKTVDIAKELGAKVFAHSMNGTEEPSRRMASNKQPNLGFSYWMLMNG